MSNARPERDKGLKQAFTRLAPELAPAADIAAIADSIPNSKPWSAEDFVQACRAAGVSARAVSGKPAGVLQRETWHAIELQDGEWASGYRHNDDHVVLAGEERGSPPEKVRLKELETRATGRVIIVAAEDSEAAEQNRAAASRRKHWFWGTIQDYRESFVYIAVAGLAINILAFALPLFIMNTYDRVFPNAAFSTLWVLAIGVMAAIGFELGLKLARARLIDAVGRRVDYRISSRLFDQILHAPLRARHESTGAYINRFNEFEVVRDFFTSTTVSMIVDVCFVFVFFLVIAFIAGWLVIVPITGFFIVLIVGVLLQRWNSKIVEQASDNKSARHNLLFETVASLSSIKSLGAEPALGHRWRQIVHAGASTNESMRRLSSFGLSAAASIQQLISVGLVVGGAYLFANGELSMGAIIAVVILSGRALAPVGTLALLMTRGRQAIASLQALNTLMELPDEFRHHGLSRPVVSAKLELRNASVRFEDSEALALDKVSLTINPGEKVGLIGRVGSGKTTLCRLLANLYQVDDGEFLVDDRDARQHDVRDLRRNIQLVGATPELFNGSIRENLTMVDPDATREQLVEAARISGLLEIVQAGEAGFDRQIGERGNRLSNGQRRILSITRAFVKPFKVLILDEPTADLDTWTEGRLISRLRESIGPDQTLIVATHRRPILELVDRFIVLDKGRVVQDGPREDVVASMRG